MGIKIGEDRNDEKDDTDRYIRDGECMLSYQRKRYCGK